MMRALLAALARFEETPEADALIVVMLFAALFGGLMLTGGL